jgi:hypothetical protein
MRQAVRPLRVSSNRVPTWSAPREDEMSRWTLTVLVAIGMAGTARAAQAQPADLMAASGQGHPTMVLHVINYAALSREVLDETKARVASVYMGIGVRTVWVESERSADQHQNGRLHLTILLLSREMADKKISAEGLKDGVFGQAHQPSGRASIFCERIATMPGAPRYFPIPLGDVIAHEVGHLVLGTNRHSRSGIMRAYANVHTIHLQTFDEAQALIIRTVLMKLASTTGR